MDEKDLKRIIESRYNSVRAFAIENDIHTQQCAPF
ncbi:Uncharacterised protein [Streptococcus pyogenes]|nr:Uncharacterised protein [Streptococcus pyogenes]